MTRSEIHATVAEKAVAAGIMVTSAAVADIERWLTENNDRRKTASEAFGYLVEGFGASYDRESDQWLIYTMPDAKLFLILNGYDRDRLYWVMDGLRVKIIEEEIDYRCRCKVNFTTHTTDRSECPIHPE